MVKDKTTINLDLPIELRDNFKILSIMNKQTMRARLIMLIEKDIEKNLNK